MQIPLQISFRGLRHSPFIESIVQSKVTKLEAFHPRITSTHVMLERSERRHRHGNLYHVRIDLNVPGREIVVRRDPKSDRSHEDLRVAIRDAFDAARRQLQNHERRRHE